MRERVFIALVASVLALSVIYEFPFCPFAALTGIPCPGCGLGRATLALLHGDVHGALHLHPLVLVAVPASLAALTGRFAEPRMSRSADRYVTAGAGILLIAFIGVWAVRFTGHLGGPVPVLSLWAAAESKTPPGANRRYHRTVTNSEKLPGSVTTVDENGVDRSQIRAMLRLTPVERLQWVGEFVESVLELRALNEARTIR